MAPRVVRPITVSVLHDHPLVVLGVSAMLTSHADVVEFVPTNAQQMPSRAVDIALFDAFTQNSPGGPSIDDLGAHPLIGTVVLYTWALTESVIAAASRRGVTAALSKSLDGPHLAQALSLIHQGRTAATSVGGSADRSTAQWPGMESGLTAREAEVISLVTSGVSNQEIAQRIFLSVNSIKSYIRSAYRTMGVTSRSQAVLWGIDHGMAPTRMNIHTPFDDLGAGLTGA